MWEPEPDAMHQRVEIVRWNCGEHRMDGDFVVVEEPLEIRVNDVVLAVTMRTPGQDDALAVGFLVSEGILHQTEDLFDVTRCGDGAGTSDADARNVVNVVVNPGIIAARPESRQRYATSSCGLCGRASIAEIRASFPPIPAAPQLSRDVIVSLPDRLRREQRTFERTGGLHAAGLFDREGTALYVEEDVGRHNAVDKVIGRAFLAGRWPLDDTILAVSGRAGFEIVQKALAARIPAVCSVSAPSSLAVDLALDSGMTLIGFLRGQTMNVYAGTENVD